MKKTIDIISIVCIACALFTTFSLYLFEAQIPASQEAEQVEKAAFANFPLDQTHFVDLEIDEETRDRLTPRELGDQFRDWLMFTVLSDTGLSAEEVGQSVFDIPSIRYGYTQPVANFEYGDTRSCCIGDGEVLALIPSGVSEAEGADYLAHIADEHRKNLGEIPRSLLVFEYEIRLDEEFGTVTRRKELDANDLFTEKAGYYEMEIDDLEDLERFMGQVYDITFTYAQADRITLGGRKIKSHKYKGIRIEDVAAIWQAEKRIHEKLTKFNDRWQKKNDQLNSTPYRKSYFDYQGDPQYEAIVEALGSQTKINDWGNVYPLNTPKESYEPPSVITSQKHYDREHSKLISAMQKEWKTQRIVEGSGFSLDPTYDYEGLANSFKLTNIKLQLLTNLSSQEGNITEEERSKVEKALADHDEIPYLELIDRLKKNTGLIPMFLFEVPLESIADVNDGTVPTALRKEFENNEIPLSGNTLTKTDEETRNVLILDNKFGNIFGLIREEDALYVQKLINLGYLIEEEGMKHKFQAARYDGDLQGTEVGMVLFYTDLLAKLWALDYMNSATGSFIEDFKAMIEVLISPIYMKEMEKLTDTRLWFGTQDNGFQVAEGGETLLFARNATRVYAASSDPLKPGLEKAPNAQSAAFLGWWNDHYAEVARFEQEYQRLNEIMKWSLLISWLNEADRGELLGFLMSVQVDHSNWFPEWIEEQPQLRFQQWESAGFYERGYKDVKTEAMSILSSEPYFRGGKVWTLSGGVSLAPKQLFKSRPGISTNVGKMIRRSNLDYAKSGSRSLLTRGGMKYDFKSLNPRSLSIVGRAKEATKLRGRYAELANLDFERVVSRTHRSLGIKASVGGKDLGTLGITKTQRGFRTAWRSRDIDLGQSLARRISRSASPDRILVNDAGLETIIGLPGKHNYLVKLSGSRSWLKMSPEGKPSASIAKGWQSRVADPRNGIRNMQLAWVDDAVIQNQLGRKGSLIMEPVQGTRRCILRYEPIRGPPTGGKALEIETGSFTIKGRIDAKTGRIDLPWEELPGNLRKDPSSLQRLIRASDLQQIRGIAKTDVPTVRITVSENRIAADDFIRNLGRGDYGNAAKHLVNNPRVIKKGLEQHLLDGLKRCDRLLADGRPVKAIHHLDDLAGKYGAKPEITLRKGIANIDRKKLLNVPETLKVTLREPLRNRLSFFDEINERLRRPGLNPTQRNNFRRIAEFGEWTDLQARNIVPKGDIVPHIEGDQLTLHYRLANPPKGQPVGLADASKLAKSKAPIYVQDSPGLNNLDWHTSIESSLQQVIRGDLGTVVRLPRGDIARFRPDVAYSPGPDVIYSLGNATRFRLVNKIPISTGGYRPYRTGEDDDDDDKEACFVISKIDKSR